MQEPPGRRNSQCEDRRQSVPGEFQQGRTAEEDRGAGAEAARIRGLLEGLAFLLAVIRVLGRCRVLSRGGNLLFYL